MCRILIASVLMATLGWVAPAWALNQPGSTAPLPIIDDDVTSCSDNNVQRCLDDEEGKRGLIDAQADGKVSPETFDPRCNLTFHLIARGAGYRNIFGWYNVKKDPANPGKTLKPALRELHAFILNDEDPPLSRTLALRDDPNYEGGLIAFFIATGFDVRVDAPEGASAAERRGKPPLEGTFENIFYSERAFNPDNGATPSIHLITWQSVAHRDSFYFGWEDLLVGGDDDFDDILTRVDGIQCAGGGAACDTGKEGVCSEGTLQCQRGELTCVPNVEASEEVCNALDDDCNGEVDDGDLCQEGYVCSRGKCVPRCGTGEFKCPTGLACNADGFCIDPACLGVTCDAGKVCTGGECVDACEGVICPYGQLCRSGRCIDPCEQVTCDAEYSCHLGVCVDCDCAGCDKGYACSKNVCVEEGCQNVTCGPGTHCSDGKCVDNCDGAKCPGGGECLNGACTAPRTDPTGGETDIEDPGPIRIDPTSPDGGKDGDGDSGNKVEARPLGAVDAGDGGCGCRAAGGSGSVGAGLALAGLGLLLARRRKLGG
jgi:MYXO-CTERM domain-containing protein